MKVKIINRSSFPAPAYATDLSAGMDLKADIAEPVTLGPLQRAVIPTGLYIALPEGTEAQIRPRSGLAAQMVIARYEKIQWEETESLEETSRGEGGFGSTGR